MVSINISLKREAYEFLKALKVKDKSFSDVVLEFKDIRATTDVMRLFGALKNANIDWKAKEEGMKAFRDSFNKHVAETRKKMERLKNDRAR